MMRQLRLGRISRVAPLCVPAVVLAAVVVSAGCAIREAKHVEAAIEPWAHDGFVGRRITTDHFLIISTLDDLELEEALPAFLEAAYRRYQAMLPSPKQVRTKLTMYVFGTRTEWARFTRRRYPDRYEVYSRIHSGGFTERDASVSFYVSRPEALATLAHEGWHQYAQSRSSNSIPPWLNEGLACYHEAVDFSGPTPRFTPKHNTLRINSLREAVQMDRLLTLTELVNTDAGKVITQDHSHITQAYYAQAWGLVTFLRHGSGLRCARGFGKLLEDLASGAYRVRISAAQLASPDQRTLTEADVVFQTYFGCLPAEMEEAYYDHLVRLCGF